MEKGEPGIIYFTKKLNQKNLFNGIAVQFEPVKKVY
jgi:hypothetical protein